MRFPIPDKWTTNHFLADFNPCLSERDKAFIATLYPYDKENIVAKEEDKMRKYQGVLANSREEF